MITLIKNVDLYTPDHAGIKDILVAGKTIAAVEDSIGISGYDGLNVMDGKGLIAAPGLIDNHVHIAGGGGEGGFETQTPEIDIKDLVRAGVTTVIGVRGTDGFTRSMENLIAKAKFIRKKGFSCWILTGSYQTPIRTLTGSIETDIMLIDEIIGVGEIALADHRSSHPTPQDLIAIASAARVGGMLSGKSGVVNIHLGDGKAAFDFLYECLESSNIPRRHFVPTHVNRNFDLMCQGVAYAKKGGFIDLTSSGYTKGADDERTKCSRAVKIALDAGVSIDRVSISSDGQGSLPLYNEQNELRAMTVGTCASLLTELQDLVTEENIPFSTALKPLTVNPAKIYNLPGKGIIQKNFDADIVLFDNDLNIKALMVSGICHYPDRNGTDR